MAVILHIETSTNVCSLALTVNGEAIITAEDREGPSHAAKLPIFVQTTLSALKTMGLTLDAVAVSAGPGSYTGLRIGVSTAKGICYGFGIPLIAIDTLDILAVAGRQAMPDPIGFLVPMIDARRMEVYTAIYNDQLERKTPVEAKIVDETTYRELLKEDIYYFFGNGAAKFKDVIISNNVRFIDNIRSEERRVGKECRL